MFLMYSTMLVSQNYLVNNFFLHEKIIFLDKAPFLYQFSGENINIKNILHSFEES